MRTLNLGILAHVDAGKTSLTERLLHAAGVIDTVGRVDDGSTQTDTLALERERGITIRSAVVSFVIGDVIVNLIDKPGHPDFIAEVERVLGVLDGAVLVVSAVEGVQAQTRVLMRTLQRLAIPTLIFVNKVDRAGADDVRVLRDIAGRLSPGVIALGSVRGLGTRDAVVSPLGVADPAFRSRLSELLADHDDAILAAFVDDAATIPYRTLCEGLESQTRRSLVYPVFVGSAITGAGVDALVDAITTLLPAGEGDRTGPVSGSVFKIDRGPAGEKVAYVRMFSGTVRIRDRLTLGPGSQATVTAISVFERGAAVRQRSVSAGRIAQLRGLQDVQIGDAIGMTPRGDGRRHFAPPTLETVVRPVRPGDKGRLHVALTQLAEQDPLINLRQDETWHEIFLSLYGEVQKEVIQATLAADYEVDIAFNETTTICIERPTGSAEATEVIASATNPFLATVGLRVDPAPVGTGVGFALGIEPGSLPMAFQKAVEETVVQTLRQGIHGWEVTDCTVTLTRSGYWPRQSHAHGTFDKSMSSTAGDFRNLTPLVLIDALRQCGIAVYEPMHHFLLDIPCDTYGAVLPAVVRSRGIPEKPTAAGSSYRVEGLIPAATVHGLRQQLPGLTRGEGVLETDFDGYQQVRGAVPTRVRSDHNPLDRKEYLLHVLRRV